MRIPRTGWILLLGLAAALLPALAIAGECPPGPCPSSLEFAVNGCSCAGETYTESTVSAPYCCASGYSDSECPEALADETLAESTFGSTESEVEAQLVTVYIQGWPIQVHEKAAPAFREVASRLESVNYTIQEPIQSYNWRDVRGHTVMSFHSFGIAVDINPETNPECGVTTYCRCYNDMVTDMPHEFVQAFRDSGFDWGGDWTGHPDPMHFEWNQWH
ncbi:MAG TPA: M15 family metallopeptidase [Chloroflexota bacterium]|nr:M15 family metallopeptidase [Chloroflexota bacterium]